MGANLAGRRVAVVGAGPAGLYGLQALLALPDVTGIDVFDSMPTPYGLVRYGVAADHMKTKSVIRTLRVFLESDRVRFLGNVRLGRDLAMHELLAHYDAVLLATGASEDRRLGIPGEDLPGSHGASRFVSWYSGHPDAPSFDLCGVETAVVVGAGNVALDVTRILCKDPAQLVGTDMPDQVLARLRESRLRTVHLVARRGPAEAKFSVVELRELGDLSDVEIEVDPRDLDLDEASRAEVETSRSAATTVRMFESWSQRGVRGLRRRIVMHFWTRPVEVAGAGRVQSVVLERGGERVEVAAQAMLRAIGYRVRPPDGLPFDSSRGVVLSERGRVAPGIYVAGWLKREPRGVIGTNRADAEETVAALQADLAWLPPRAECDSAAIVELLAARGVQVVDLPGWHRLEAHEERLGAARSAPSVKLPGLDDMLSVCLAGGVVT